MNVCAQDKNSYLKLPPWLGCQIPKKIRKIHNLGQREQANAKEARLTTHEDTASELSITKRN